MGGYEETEEGMERAIAEGFCMVNDGHGDENTLLTGEPALELWREMGTEVSISFPVNDATVSSSWRRPADRAASSPWTPLRRTAAVLPAT